MSNRLANILLIALALVFLVSQGFFILNQTQQALVIQMGSPVRVVQNPGLEFKIPFVQNVVVYDKRVLNVAPPGEEVLLEDQKRLVVDAYARYRILDVLRFYQKLGTQQGAEDRLGAALRSALRSEMAKVTQPDMLSEKRQVVMDAIRDEMNRQTKEFGVDIIDVRIRAADLPSQVQESVFNLMKSQRQQEAALIRAEGDEISATIRAKAERERTVLLADAERNAQIIRGEGDREAIRIFAESFGKDPEFFSFYRSMQAYKEALANPDTTLLVAPDGEFFKYFKSGKKPKP